MLYIMNKFLMFYLLTFSKSKCFQLLRLSSYASVIDQTIYRIHRARQKERTLRSNFGVQLWHRDEESTR